VVEEPNSYEVGEGGIQPGMGLIAQVTPSEQEKDRETAPIMAIVEKSRPVGMVRSRMQEADTKKGLRSCDVFLQWSWH